MTIRHAPMTVDQLLNKILLTVMLALGAWGVSSIDLLNRNMAVILSNVAEHKERLDTHDHKFERVFNFMYATHPKYRDTEED